MSQFPCPFCDYVTKGVQRSDHLRKHVQRKHPSGGALTFTDNGGYHMIHPTTEIFLKVKDVNGSEKYGDAFCVDCYSWLGLDAKAIRNNNRISRCEEHVCKTKQERKARTPGAKSTPRKEMDLTDDFKKAGLSKYIELTNAMELNLQATLAKIHEEVTKPTLIESMMRTMKKYRIFFDDIRKEIEDAAKDTADEGDEIDPVTDEDVIAEVIRIAFDARE